MLFTWDTSNLCIVFRQWHITSNLSLVVSLAAIVALCAGYEALREGIRRYEATLSKRVDTAPRKCLLWLPFPTLPFTFPNYPKMHVAHMASSFAKTYTSQMESPDPPRRHRGGFLKSQ
jgi:copper transporter 1